MKRFNRVCCGARCGTCPGAHRRAVASPGVAPVAHSAGAPPSLIITSPRSPETPEATVGVLDAGAVPRTLLAAAIVVLGNPHPLPIVDLANEILALWDRSPIVPTLLEGDLGPLS